MCSELGSLGWFLDWSPSKSTYNPFIFYNLLEYSMKKKCGNLILRKIVYRRSTETLYFFKKITTLFTIIWHRYLNWSDRHSITRNSVDIISYLLHYKRNQHLWSWWELLPKELHLILMSLKGNFNLLFHLMKCGMVNLGVRHHRNKWTWGAIWVCWGSHGTSLGSSC